MGSGGKSGGGTPYNKYRLSAHVGLCASSEGIELLAITVDDKEVWRGSLKEPTTFTIDKPSLFGGLQREGGMGGWVRWLPGHRWQVLNDRLAAKLGLTSLTSPGFRGVASLFFTEGGSTKGFYWQANNPYLKKFKVRLRRPPVGLDPDKALIDLPDDSEGRSQKGANPAHIIYECLTNRSWGKGGSIDSIDVESFEEAAATLYEEEFALCMKWTRQAEIEKFVGEVLDHIQAVLYESPVDGRQTLKLLRADYDPEALPVITPDTARLKNFKRKLWGEIVSEVVVTYKDAETRKDKTVTAQDLAVMAIQGGPVSTSRNYYGVAAEELAIRLAERDLAQLCADLVVCDVELDRSWWRLSPGDVVRLTWPRYGLDGVAMRVGRVTRGGSDSGLITASLEEDIFGRAAANVGVATPSAWQRPSQEPAPFDDPLLFTAPAYLAARALGLSDASELEYPASVTTILPIPNSADDLAYDLWGPRALATGNSVPALLATNLLPATGLLAAPLTRAVSSTSVALDDFSGQEPEEGDFLLIGPATEGAQEIAMVESVTDGAMTLARGMLDTVPRAWAAGTRVWILTDGQRAFEPTERAAGETLAYRLLPHTSRGILPYDDAPDETVTLSERAHLPLRPADVKVAGSAFGPIVAGAETSYAVTWANRNRGLEAIAAFRWNEATVSPEAGQTTRIEVEDTGGAVIWSAAGLGGTGHSVPRSAFGAEPEADVCVYAEKGGDRSLQGHRIRVTDLTPPLSFSGFSATAGLGNVGYSGVVAPNSGWLRGARIFRGPTTNFADATLVSNELPVTPGSTFAISAGDLTRTNLFTNADFSDGATGWTLDTGWSVASGVASINNPGAVRRISQAPSLVAGDVLRCAVDITEISASNFAFQAVGATTNTSGTRNTVGQLLTTVTVPASPTSIGVRATATSIGSIDNLVTYVQTADCLAQGAAYFFIVPVTQAGTYGTPSAATLLTVI